MTFDFMTDSKSETNDLSALKRAEKALADKIDENGQDWLAQQLGNLSEVYQVLKTNPASAADLKALVSVASDFETIALSVGDQHLAQVARSLHLFAQIAQADNPVVMALIGVHLDALASLHAMASIDRSGNPMTDQLIEELSLAVKKVSGG